MRDTKWASTGTDLALSTIRKAESTAVSGSKTGCKAKVCSTTPVGKSLTKDNGKKTCSMAMECYTMKT